MSNGYFEIKKSSDGQFHFVLKAGNHEIILQSELYHAKQSAEKGIASVQSNCSNDERYEKQVTKNGKPYFNLKAANHQVIGTSEMYESEAARDKGIIAVKNNGTTTFVKDLTLSE